MITIILLALMLPGNSLVFSLTIDSRICDSENFGCDEPSRYRCGCDWQNSENKYHPLLEDTCIPIRWTCDAFTDCLDGSDEKGCSCPEDSYKCGCGFDDFNCKEGRGCVPFDSVCNGSSTKMTDCRDKSDESICRCAVGEYKCGCPDKRSDCYNRTSVSGCIELFSVCDGCSDCPDNSDEAYCACAEGEFRCGCGQQEQLCSNGRNCITHTLVCNGVKDCKDGSDEIGCEGCSSDEFCCDVNCLACISKHKVCDGSLDCPDGAEEKECCATKKFVCNNRTVTNKYLDEKIIASHLQCDGRNNCENWSDEINCTYEAMELCACNQQSTIECTANPSAIKTEWMCDGIADCPDGSDEVCVCSHNEFQCETSSYCLDMRFRCNGINDCEDWSDEKECECPLGMFRCACFGIDITCSSRIGCINNSTMRCDGVNNCGDWSDEVGCECPPDKPFACDCYRGNITCTSSTGCYKLSDIRDSYNDCGDYTDEFGRGCNEAEVRCGCITSVNCSSHERCIPITMINDGEMDCRSGEDEMCNVTTQLCKGKEYKVFVCQTLDKCTHSPLCVNTTCYCSNTVVSKNNECDNGFFICTSEFIDQNSNNTFPEKCQKTLQCPNEKAILLNNFCDRNVDCIGDEVTSKPGFKCAMNTLFDGCVLPQENLFDDVAQCADRSDICFINGKFVCFYCLDRKLIISPSQVCDGVIDCFDFSDECLCENRTICSSVLGNGIFSKEQCPPSQMLCNGTCANTYNVLCNNVIDCINATDEIYCHPSFTAREQFEVIECYNKGGKIKANLCDRVPECDNLQDECLTCSHKPSFCFDDCHDEYLIGDRYCDGRIDEAYRHINKSECLKGFDEKNCTERFYCAKGHPININKIKVCNGIMDCYDGSDEFIYDKSCPNRVYCESGDFPVSIHFTKAGDGIFDCDSGSDECPTQTEDKRFSSKDEMIAQRSFFIAIWIMAVLAIVGNVSVIIYSTKQLFSTDKSSLISRCNHMLLINLGLADLLMGIYLIIIGSKAVQFSGKYCLQDKMWRTSGLCKAAGVLAMMASETSVLLLSVLTAFRLSSVFNTFKNTFYACMKRYVTLAFLCWAASATLALIPIAPSLTGYFVSSVWFPSSIFSGDVVTWEEMQNFAVATKYLTSNSTQVDFDNWNDLTSFLQSYFPAYFPAAEMGYYSDSPVCLPRLFVDRKGQAWAYSMFIITLNFLLFLFIAVANITLMRKSKTLLISSKATEQNKAMQRKIFRLLFTDFICWVPICIMAYIQFGGVELGPTTYVISAVILLPVNSALNPILYSSVFEKCWKLFFSAPKHSYSTKRTGTTSQNSSTIATNGPARKSSKGNLAFASTNF